MSSRGKNVVVPNKRRAGSKSAPKFVLSSDTETDDNEEGVPVVADQVWNPWADPLEHYKKPAFLGSFYGNASCFHRRHYVRPLTQVVV